MSQAGINPVQNWSLKMPQRNQGYGQGIRLGVLQGVPFHRLLESYFLWTLAERSMVISGRSRGGSPTALQEPYLNSTFGFA